MSKIPFASTHIAGFSYWNGAKIFSDLTIGQKLRLVREKDNRFDSYAVAIFYKKHKIGYLPREENESIAKFLDAGYEKIFSARINRISTSEHPENQIGIIVYLAPKK